MKVYDSFYQMPPETQPNCVALGLFDGLHIGHREVVRAAVRHAEEHGMTPCVFTFSMNRDHPRAKGASRLLTTGIFLEILAELGVKKVFRPDFSEFRDLSPEQFVRDIMLDRVGARFLSCGENFSFGKGAAAHSSDLAALCGDRAEVRVMPIIRIDGMRVSSTRIRANIREGSIPFANRMLGRRFSIDFEVVHGRALGRTLGTPTINQPFPEDFIKPRFGVYASIAHIAGNRHIGVTNVGVKPTVGSDRVLAETYIHDFSGDLYGSRVRVDFLQFIRPEQKFDSVEQLRAQILRDSDSAVRICMEYED